VTGKNEFADPDRERVFAALDAMVARARAARALDCDAAGRDALERAAARTRAAVVEGPEPLLTVAIAGGTGVGKSTLINALAGSAIAGTSETRPTTTRLQVYHHREVTEGGLPKDLGSDALFVAHERAELRRKILVDTPDLDSFVIGHRATTRRLLQGAGLVLYVFSPEKYLEERTWSVLREEQRFSASAAVLNKVDRVPPAEVERLTEDLRARFASIGLDEIRIFRVSARAHVDAEEAAPRPAIDETEALRAYLEHELREGDVARMVRARRERVLAHLEEAIERVAPADLAQRVDAATEDAARAADDVAECLGAGLADRLRAVEGLLAPLAVLKQHERFRGPFRAWLAVADFFRYGISGMVQKLLGRTPAGEAGWVRRLLAQGEGRTFADASETLRRSIQDALYRRGLPVRGWVEATRDLGGGGDLAGAVADEIEAGFDLRALPASARTRVVAAMLSFLGFVVPVGLAVYSLYLLAGDFLDGRYTGFALLGHLVAGIILLFCGLHALSVLLLPGVRGLGRGVGKRAIRDVVRRTAEEWIHRYRTALAEEAEGMRAPIAALRAWADALGGASPTPGARETPRPRTRRRPAADAAAPPLSEAPRARPAPAPGTLAENLRSAAERGREGRSEK